MVTVRMTLRRWRQLLVALNAGLAAAIVAVALAMTLLPLEAQLTEPLAEAPAAVAPAAKPAVRPASDYAVIYQREAFRQAAVATAETSLPLAVTLEGTAVDPRASCALFRTKDGRTSWISLGEKIEGAELLAVREGEVTIQFAGREVVLKIKKDKKE